LSSTLSRTLADNRGGRQLAEDAGDGLDATDAQAISDELVALEGLSLEQVLRAGLESTLRLLVAKVKAGVASHQEMAILRNILRDNGMVLALPPKTIEGKVVNQPPLDLPKLATPDYSED
jgi:hypothetical protein